MNANTHSNARPTCAIYLTQIMRELPILLIGYWDESLTNLAMNLHTPKVIVIDNDQHLHTDYDLFFESYLDVTLAGLFTKSKEAMKKLDILQPDIIFIEILESSTHEIAVIQKLKLMNNKTKIIVLSVSKDIELIKKSFRSGAVGYITKPVSQRTLYNALHSIRCQGAFISNDVAQQVVSMFKRKSFPLFSERENQVIDFLQQGATYKYIAEKLYVTSSAINFHIQNIYLKLNVNSKSEALLKLAELENS